MIKFIKSLYNNMSETGIKFPFAYDALSKKPSVTLLFAYITFLMMVASLVLQHLKLVTLESTITMIIVWVLALTFYRLRELDKINVNLKTGSIGLEDDDLSNNKQEKDEK